MSDFATNSNDARIALEGTNLEDDEQVVSIDVKSLYIDIPFGEAIKVALKELCSSDAVPEVPRLHIKILLRLAVTNALFKCKKMVHLIGRFSHRCFAGGSFGKFVHEIF